MSSVGAAAQRASRRCRPLTAVVVAGWLAAIAAGAPASAQEIGYTASLFVARGTYSADKVTSLYVFNSLDVTGGAVRVSLSVPFVRQQTSFADATPDPLTGGAADLEQTDTGFGDPLVRVDVLLVNDLRSGVQIGVAGSVKPSLADAESGLGTGAADYAGGGTLFKAAGLTSIFADVMFWKYGDPEGVDYQDTWSYSVGLGRMIGRGRWSAMASLAGFSEGIDGAPAPLQLNLTMLALAARRQSIAVTAGFGLNDSSGDFSLGLSWRISR